MSDLTGRTLGQYEVLEEVGSGGMANVYRGIQPSIGRQVAIKVLPTHFLQDRTFLERFTREVQVIAHLQHPRILPVVDFGEQDGLPYIVMAYMPGGTLLDRVRQHPQGMSLNEAARIVEQISEGLDFAHRRGVIHRDFKPSNVLFDDENNAYLSDFGIAKVAETTASLTGGRMIGTPGYMAPELGQPGKPTAAVDVYALGVTLFEMLTGTGPYDADTPMRLMYMHINQPVPDIRHLRPELPDETQYVIERAMAKEPPDRYATAVDLAADLYAVSSGTWEGAPNWQTLPLAGERVATQALPPDESIYDQVTMDVPGDLDAAPTLKGAGPAQPTRRPRSALPLLAGIGGLLVITAVALVLLGIFPRRSVPAAGSDITPIPPTDTPTTLPTEEAVEPALAEATLTPLTPTAQRLDGSVEIRSGSGGVFEALDSTRFVAPGDAIRTGEDGVALLTITPGVYVELHENAGVELVSIEEAAGKWQVEVNHTTGLAYHVVAPEANIDYIAHTPDGVVHVAGTKYWTEEQAEGWCYIPTEGSILVDIGEDDENAGDDYLLHAADGANLLVHEDGSTGDCLIVEPTPTDIPTPTPTDTPAGSDENATATPTEKPTATATSQPDPCADHGGLQWEGDSCACSGVITHVIICNDGTKWDTPTEETCQPDSSCEPGGAAVETGVVEVAAAAVALPVTPMYQARPAQAGTNEHATIAAPTPLGKSANLRCGTLRARQCIWHMTTGAVIGPAMDSSCLKVKHIAVT